MMNTSQSMHGAYSSPLQLSGWHGWPLWPSPSLHLRLHQWLEESFQRTLSGAKFACSKIWKVEMRMLRRRFTRKTFLQGFSLSSRYFMLQDFFTEWPGISMGSARQAKCAQLGNIREIFWDWNQLFGRACLEAALCSSKTLSEFWVNTI